MTVALTKSTRQELDAALTGALFKILNSVDSTLGANQRELFEAAYRPEYREALAVVRAGFGPNVVKAHGILEFAVPVREGVACVRVFADAAVSSYSSSTGGHGNGAARLLGLMDPSHPLTPRVSEWADSRITAQTINAKIEGLYTDVCAYLTTVEQLLYLWPGFASVVPSKIQQALEAPRKRVIRKLPVDLRNRLLYARSALDVWLARAAVLDDSPPPVRVHSVNLLPSTLTQ